MKKIKNNIINIPFKGFKIHSYFFGDLKSRTPIIVLHGGPGSCDERYEPLYELSKYGIPLIFYDQLGGGYSKVPKGNISLWTFETFLDELKLVMDFYNQPKYIILGHSWGGMLALEYLKERVDSRIDKLILFSTLPSTKMWNDEHLKLIDCFPKDEKEELIKQMNGVSFDINIVRKANKRFYSSHLSQKKNKKFIYETKHFPKTNKEIYSYMWGDSELFGTGTLKTYDVSDSLNKIKIPTLILSGKDDESTPFMNKFMNERIKGSKWIVYEHSHHIAYAEEPELVIKDIINFVK